jgi:GNAT superfamily N-acetyltransferase
LTGEPPNLRFEKLTSNLSSSTFDCTEEDGTDPHGLQDFIANEPLKYQTERLGVTYLVFQDSDPVAFLTVSMTCLKISELDNEEQVPEVRVPYPALLLGRLAVEKNHRHNDIGTFLCQWVIGLARALVKSVLFSSEKKFKCLSGRPRLCDFPQQLLVSRDEDVAVQFTKSC